MAWTDASINEKRKQVAIEKAIAILKRGYEDVVKEDSIKAEVRLEEEFCFCYVTMEVESSLWGKRYAMCTFSALCIETYYSTANVIDKDRDYTIDNVVKNTKNFFKHMATLIDKVN